MLCTYIYARDSPQFTPLAPGGVNLCILLFISQYAQLREGALWVPLLRSTPLTKIGVLYPRGTPLGVCLGQTFYPHCRLALTCCAQFCERRSAILASGCLSVPRGDPKWESTPPPLAWEVPRGEPQKRKRPLLQIGKACLGNPKLPHGKAPSARGPKPNRAGTQKLRQQNPVRERPEGTLF